MRLRGRAPVTGSLIAAYKAVKASLDAAIKTATTDPYTQLPQIVLLATSSTSALYSGSSGYAPPPGSSSSSPLSSLEKISPDSVFDLFSATKLVTCIAALQLVEQGLLDLNDDASQWVPELNGKEIFTGWSEEEKPTYKSTGAVVSVEMLLTHTAVSIAGRRAPNGPTDVWLRFKGVCLRLH